MRCEHYRAWISDDIDGSLARKKKRKLEAHLSRCPDCPAYRKDLLRLQAESRLDEADPVAPEYYEKFSAALETRLRREGGIGRRTRRPALSWRWAWISAPLALAMILAVLIFRGGRASFGREILSFEGCLESVYLEIGEDDESAAEFNRFLSGSLLGGEDGAGLEDGLELWSDPLFWRSLSDEDLRSIETEIMKESRS